MRAFRQMYVLVLTMPKTIFNAFVMCSQQLINSKNLIGLNRARRPHNAIFVTFVDPIVPMVCLEAATINWKRVCLKENDRRAEEQLRKVCEQLKLKLCTKVL